MARCIICHTEFYGQSMSSPAEPCDCERNFTRTDWRDNPEFDVTGLRAEWAHFQDGTGPDPREAQADENE